MSGDLPHTTRDPQARHDCPACGQPLQVLAKRHKVLGAWVPEWEVQPCTNPECPRYEAPEGVLEAGAGPRTGPGGGAEDPAGGADATSTYVTGKNGETGRSPAPG
ncbi:hypothetical protein [Streptomyces roseoviridis]|uniref:Uncharacterized protein n=1 Tax=Streptomyces roseoviridis TaxID=67361 RepID=A0ABV5QQI0_9ACTN